MTSKEFGKLLQDKLTSEYGVELSVASNQQIYRSLALICRQMMSENHKKFQSKAIGTGTKQVYYPVSYTHLRSRCIICAWSS